MRKQILFLVIPVVLVVTVLLGGGRSLAQGPDTAQPQAGLGPAFTYQGQLKDGAGNPITKSCDFLFSLWDALSAGTQVGANSTVAGVAVANGYFAALVNAGGEFGANAFTGEARWLEIAVQCSGDPAFTTLTPRQELTAAPYALSLRPGAKVVGSVSGGAAILGQNTAANGVGVYALGPNAVVADSSSPGYAAMVGRNYATTGAGYGVYGLSASADPSTAGLYGWANAASGQTYGAYARSDSPDGSGVYGEATATSGAAKGVVGRTAAPGVSGVFTYYSIGVDGYATSTSGPTAGVWGQSASTEGIGVRGWASANSGATYGVYGQSDSAYGAGVYGIDTAAALGTGVVGIANGYSGMGVYGYASATSGVTSGVYGQSDSPGGSGMYGVASAASGTTFGLYGQSDSTQGRGVYGYSTASTGQTYGVYGKAASVIGIGVCGTSASDGAFTVGVRGESASPDGTGVFGIVTGTPGEAGIAVWGMAALPGWAGSFNGQVDVTGNLYKGGGGFRIDDPLDPAHKYLYHSFVESPDMKNIYDGVVTLDQDGTAWVEMPDWFQVINQDFRYQLTCIGGYAPVYVAQKIQDNRFQIAGGTPGLEVSWMVTGIRHDPYAEAHRIPVEEVKPADAQGTYLHPELYGQPVSATEGYSKWPAEMKAGSGPAPAPAAQPR